MSISIDMKTAFIIGAFAAATVTENKGAPATFPKDFKMPPRLRQGAAKPPDSSKAAPSNSRQIYYYDLYSQQPGEELFVDTDGKITAQMLSAIRRDLAMPEIANEIRSSTRGAVKWAVLEMMQHFGVCNSAIPPSEGEQQRLRLGKLAATISEIQRDYHSVSLTPDEKSKRMKEAQIQFSGIRELITKEEAEIVASQKRSVADTPDTIGYGSLVCKDQAPLISIMLGLADYKAHEIWKGECCKPNQKPAEKEDVNHVFIYVPADSVKGEAEAIIECTEAPTRAYKKIIGKEEFHERTFLVTEDGFRYRKTEIIPCRVEFKN